MARGGAGRPGGAHRQGPGRAGASASICAVAGFAFLVRCCGRAGGVSHAHGSGGGGRTGRIGEHDRTGQHGNGKRRPGRQGAIARIAPGSARSGRRCRRYCRCNGLARCAGQLSSGSPWLARQRRAFLSGRFVPVRASGIFPPVAAAASPPRCRSATRPAIRARRNCRHFSAPPTGRACSGHVLGVQPPGLLNVCSGHGCRCPRHTGPPRKRAGSTTSCFVQYRHWQRHDPGNPASTCRFARSGAARHTAGTFRQHRYRAPRSALLGRMGPVGHAPGAGLNASCLHRAGSIPAAARSGDELARFASPGCSRHGGIPPCLVLTGRSADGGKSP